MSSVITIASFITLCVGIQAGIRPGWVIFDVDLSRMTLDERARLKHMVSTQLKRGSGYLSLSDLQWPDVSAMISVEDVAITSEAELLAKVRATLAAQDEQRAQEERDLNLVRERQEQDRLRLLGEVEKLIQWIRTHTVDDLPTEDPIGGCALVRNPENVIRAVASMYSSRSACCLPLPSPNVLGIDMTAVGAYCIDHPECLSCVQPIVIPWFETVKQRELEAQKKQAQEREEHEQLHNTELLGLATYLLSSTAVEGVKNGFISNYQVIEKLKRWLSTVDAAWWSPDETGRCRLDTATVSTEKMSPEQYERMVAARGDITLEVEKLRQSCNTANEACCQTASVEYEHMLFDEDDQWLCIAFTVRLGTVVVTVYGD